LRKTGAELPSLSTFQRKVRKRMGSAQLAYATGGSKAFRNTRVYLRNNYPNRLHSVLLDHTELPIWVVPRGHKQAQKPWMTAVMDGYTRYVLAWVLTWGTPTSEEVRAALIQAITIGVAPDGETPIGGLPYRAVWDRGLDFLANIISDSCTRLGVIPVALHAYSPHHKGALERFWGFLKRDLLPPLPGYCDGPKDIRGNHAIATAAMSEDDFLPLLIEWMDSYHLEHVNRNTGATALEMWQSDPTPLVEVPIEQLRVDFLIAKDAAKVSKNGVRFDRIDFVAPELRKVIGRTVQIRYLPHDRSFIEVFSDDEHLCTAYPVDQLTPDEQNDIVQGNHAERRLGQRRFSSANRLRRANHATSRLEVDKQHRRHVVDDPAGPTTSKGMLGNGKAALERLLGPDDGDGDDQESRLF
jgi:putative transposase